LLSLATEGNVVGPLNRSCDRAHKTRESPAKAHPDGHDGVSGTHRDELAEAFGDDELLDAMMLTGWYHAISYVANGARVTLEQGRPRFEEVVGRGDSDD